MAKVFTYKGKTLEELQKIDIKEFIKLIPSRQRRSLKRGFTESQKKFLLKVDRTISGKNKKPLKTQDRNLIVFPKMVGLTINIYNGKEYVRIEIMPEMISHRLGEFSLTRKSVKHSAPGIGATKSSAYASVK